MGHGRYQNLLEPAPISALHLHPVIEVCLLTLSEMISTCILNVILLLLVIDHLIHHNGLSSLRGLSFFRVLQQLRILQLTQLLPEHLRLVVAVARVDITRLHLFPKHGRLETLSTASTAAATSGDILLGRGKRSLEVGVFFDNNHLLNLI